MKQDIASQVDGFVVIKSLQASALDQTFTAINYKAG
jgi:hypothetical protein